MFRQRYQVGTSNRWALRYTALVKNRPRLEVAKSWRLRGAQDAPSGANNVCSVSCGDMEYAGKKTWYRAVLRVLRLLILIFPNGSSPERLGACQWHTGPRRRVYGS